MGYTVTAYQDANVRDSASLMGNVVSQVEANQTYDASGWSVGDTVTDNGTSNNVWVELNLHTGGLGYVSAVYLVGDAYGNLPSNAALREV